MLLLLRAIIARRGDDAVVVWRVAFAAHYKTNIK